MSSLIITQIKKIPLIKEGDKLSHIIYHALLAQNIHLEDGDILGVTSKIVSKAEGWLVNLKTITPSAKAKRLSKRIGRDPRLVELILSETREIIRATKNAFIVEHNLGFICANAGIDHSNVQSGSSESDDWYLLLPKNPDHSAQIISEELNLLTQKCVGVIVIDSHGRPWRLGIVGTVIGTSLVPTLVDLRGKEDIFGYKLRITMVGAADELAASASLMMGQANERVPVVHIRGFPYPLAQSSIKDVLRPKKMDLFR